MGVKSVGSASRHTPKPSVAPAVLPRQRALHRERRKKRKTRGEDIKKKGACVCRVG